MASSSGRTASRASTSARRGVEHGAPFVDGRAPQLEVAAQRRGLRAQPVELGPTGAGLVALQLGRGQAVAGRFDRFGSDRRDRGLQLLEARGERGPAGVERGDPDLDLAAQPCRERGHLVELDPAPAFLLVGLQLGPAGGRESLAGDLDLGFGEVARHLGRVGGRGRVGERGGCHDR